MTDELFILSELPMNVSTFGCIGVNGALFVALLVSLQARRRLPLMSHGSASCASMGSCVRSGLPSGLHDRSQTSGVALSGGECTWIIITRVLLALAGAATVPKHPSTGLVNQR